MGPRARRAQGIGRVVVGPRPRAGWTASSIGFALRILVTRVPYGTRFNRPHRKSLFSASADRTQAQARRRPLGRRPCRPGRGIWAMAVRNRQRGHCWRRRARWGRREGAWGAGAFRLSHQKGLLQSRGVRAGRLAGPGRFASISPQAPRQQRQDGDPALRGSPRSAARAAAKRTAASLTVASFSRWAVSGAQIDQSPAQAQV